MKRDTACAIACSALVWLMAFPSTAGDRTMEAFLAICRAERYVETQGSPRLAIETGMGDGGFPVATASRTAQQWFDYGIKLFHAYYHEDTKQAFDKTVAADPKCAFCLWGQALSRGPMQNYDVEEADLKAGLEIARKAQAAARTAREKLMTAALVRRYSRAQDVAAERDFAADLLKAEAAGPPTPDLRLIAAEVLLTAWRRGDHDQAKAAMALIEPILHGAPRNTAAIHYYIHATELAGQPGLALAYAEKLAALAPKASHLVHMAAHTFFRVGRYEDAATINAFALGVDADHLAETATPGPLPTALYYGHNLAFGMAGSLMSGDRVLALKFADHLHKAYPEKAFAADGMSISEGQRFTIYARFDPRRMLALPEPAADHPLTRALYHYARAEAFAALRDIAGVAREAALVTGDGELLTVARGVLAGRLAMLQGRHAEAARIFETAAGQQETLLNSSMDPPAWWYPIRRSAAAAWLRDGQFSRAAEAARQSLAGWPGDPLALLVLSKAEDGLGNAAEARRHEAAARGTWEGDIGETDITIIG